MTKYLSAIKYWFFAGAAMPLYAAGFQKGGVSQKISNLKGVANASKIAKASRYKLETCVLSSACTTDINGDFCLIYEPVYMDYERDTRETVRQVDRNNAVYFVLCDKLAKP